MANSQLRFMRRTRTEASIRNWAGATKLVDRRRNLLGRPAGELHGHGTATCSRVYRRRWRVGWRDEMRVSLLHALLVTGVGAGAHTVDAEAAVLLSVERDDRVHETRR